MIDSSMDSSHCRHNKFTFRNLALHTMIGHKGQAELSPQEQFVCNRNWVKMFWVSHKSSVSRNQKWQERSDRRSDLLSPSRPFEYKLTVVPEWHDCPQQNVPNVHSSSTPWSSSSQHALNQNVCPSQICCHHMSQTPHAEKQQNWKDQTTASSKAKVGASPKRSKIVRTGESKT